MHRTKLLVAGVTLNGIQQNQPGLATVSKGPLGLMLPQFQRIYQLIYFHSDSDCNEHNFLRQNHSMKW